MADADKKLVLIELTWLPDRNESAARLNALGGYVKGFDGLTENEQTCCFLVLSPLVPNRGLEACIKRFEVDALNRI